MIETACELTENRISGHEIKKILGFAREMIASPIEVLDGVNETIQYLSGKFKLMLITKGDLLDQETKLARSGLGKFFSNVEIVANKDKSSYHSILQRQHLNPKEFVMVGNSLKSDILPVLECGGKAIHIPYETEWFHEKVSDDDLIDKNYLTLESIIQLLDFDWKKI
jgi:putative hydrolase of the HAD superfamily